MPNSPQHREKAVRNLAALATIDVALFPDWAAVMAFYRAVHLVERLAAREGPPVHHENHHDRADYVRRRHRAIRDDYNTLFDAGLVARYGTIHQFESQFSCDYVRDELIGGCLRRITDYVSAEFGGGTT